ncbi:MAG: hypothetical protein KF770_30610 [Anaerolineae bacterium]|nr:hypothetical protein [Anaerolineae bacterium]
MPVESVSATLICDQCRQVSITFTIRHLDIESEARLRGWQITAWDTILCPACQERPIQAASKKINPDAVAQYRLWAIQPILENADKYPSLKEAIQARVAEVKHILATGNAPIQQAYPGQEIYLAASAASFTRWLRDYTADGNDLQALLPNFSTRGRKAESYPSHRAETIMQEVIEARKGDTVDEVWVEIIRRVADWNRERPPEDWLNPPGRATVHRRLKESRQQNQADTKW